MRKSRIPLLLIAAAIVVAPCAMNPRLSAQDTNAGSPDQPNRQIWMLASARSLEGMEVQSARGETLGHISDVVLNMRSGCVAFLLIEDGGVAGFGTEVKPAPPGAVSLATAKRGVVALNTTPERWRQAPQCDDEPAKSLADSGRAREIYRFYQQPWPTGDGPPTEQLALASELIDKRVTGAQDEDLGRIQDVLVDLRKPRSVFALLKPGAFLAEADKPARNQFFAVAVNDLKSSRRGSRFLLEATSELFRQARPMEAANWKQTGPAGGAPVIYRYVPRGRNAASTTSSPAIAGMGMAEKH